MGFHYNELTLHAYVWLYTYMLHVSAVMTGLAPNAEC